MGLTNGDTSLSTPPVCDVAGAHVAVGTYPITCHDAVDPNYSITYVAGTLTVTPKSVTVTADGQSKVYGQADPTLTYQVSPALESGDSFTGALTRNPGENVGAYAITQGDLALSSNYSLTYVGANLAITQRAVTVTADAGQSKVYGSADPTFTYQVSPALESGDVFTGALSRVSGQNVGLYAITQGTLDNSNYDITFQSADFEITPKSVTATADAGQSKVYGQADPTFTYQVLPALESGDVFTGALSRAPGENVGTYAITQGDLALSSNYTLTYVGVDFSITPKSATITADAQTKAFGQADPVFTHTTVGLTNGDTSLATPPVCDVAGAHVAVGTYPITCHDAVDPNYSITYTAGTLTVTPKSVTVTADAQTKVYGQADPTFTYSVAPALESGDVFTGALSRAPGENVGLYAITQGDLALSSNYSLTYVGADFAITQRAVTVTADAGQSKVYGSADPTFTYQVSPALESGDSFTGALDRAPGQNVGLYAITQGTLDNSNYDITFVGADFAITQACGDGDRGCWSVEGVRRGGPDVHVPGRRRRLSRADTLHGCARSCSGPERGALRDHPGHAAPTRTTTSRSVGATSRSPSVR